MAVDLAVIALAALGAGVAAVLAQLLLPKWVWLTTAIPAAVTGVIVFIPFVYFWITVAMSGQTVGKALLGLRIVRMDGRRPGFIWALVRTLAYLVSMVPLFAGFLWILVDSNRRGWHDHIAGSRVVFGREREPGP